MQVDGFGGRFDGYDRFIRTKFNDSQPAEKSCLTMIRQYGKSPDGIPRVGAALDDGRTHDAGIILRQGET